MDFDHFFDRFGWSLIVFSCWILNEFLVGLGEVVEVGADVFWGHG